MFPCGKRILDTVSILNLCHPVILIPDAFICILYLHHLISIVINLDLYKNCICILLDLNDLNHVIMSIPIPPTSTSHPNFFGILSGLPTPNNPMPGSHVALDPELTTTSFWIWNEEPCNLYTNLLVTCWSLWRLTNNMFFWNHKKIPWSVLKIFI